MTSNKQKKEEELQTLYDEYRKIQHEMYPIGRRLGWYDEEGSAEPLHHLTGQNVTEEETKEALEKEDLRDEMDFIDLQMKLNKVGKQIDRLEKELGIPAEESQMSLFAK